ncbi:hypothetical protein GQ42DRAFT_29050 [Ramicandelaber brevisporus]|nr:hypothetical protein GQ42DRAFT_29050 [Ramicandelaber brevisporus]
MAVSRPANERAPFTAHCSTFAAHVALHPCFCSAVPSGCCGAAAFSATLLRSCFRRDGWPFRCCDVSRLPCACTAASDCACLSAVAVDACLAHSILVSVRVRCRQTKSANCVRVIVCDITLNGC